MFKKIVIALCFFTGLCDGNASRHSAISDQNTIKQCILDTTLTRNFSNLNEIREKIKNEIIQKTNSDKVIKLVKSELLAQQVGIQDFEDWTITVMTASLITVVLLDLQETFHYDSIDIETGLFCLYEDGGRLPEKLYLSDIFKINPTGAILVIPDPDNKAFTADMEQVSLAPAIEECQKKIAEKTRN